MVAVGRVRVEVARAKGAAVRTATKAGRMSAVAGLGR